LLFTAGTIDLVRRQETTLDGQLDELEVFHEGSLHYEARLRRAARKRGFAAPRGRG